MAAEIPRNPQHQIGYHFYQLRLMDGSQQNEQYTSICQMAGPLLGNGMGDFQLSLLSLAMTAGCTPTITKTIDVPQQH